jgi:hypothetical protein
MMTSETTMLWNKSFREIFFKQSSVKKQCNASKAPRSNNIVHRKFNGCKAMPHYNFFAKVALHTMV